MPDYALKWHRRQFGNDPHYTQSLAPSQHSKKLKLNFSILSVITPIYSPSIHLFTPIYPLFHYTIIQLHLIIPSHAYFVPLIMIT